MTTTNVVIDFDEMLTTPSVPSGEGGASALIKETLDGVNGINTIFATSQNFKLGTTRLCLNGVRETHYTEISNRHVELAFVPQINGIIDQLIIEYEAL